MLERVILVSTKRRCGFTKCRDGILYSLGEREFVSLPGVIALSEQIENRFRLRFCAFNFSRKFSKAWQNNALAAANFFTLFNAMHAAKSN